MDTPTHSTHLLDRYPPIQNRGITWITVQNKTNTKEELAKRMKHASTQHPNHEIRIFYLMENPLQISTLIVCIPKNATQRLKIRRSLTNSSTNGDLPKKHDEIFYPHKESWLPILPPKTYNKTKPPREFRMKDDEENNKSPQASL